MPLFRTHSAAIFGIEARPIDGAHGDPLLAAGLARGADGHSRNRRIRLRYHELPQGRAKEEGRCRSFSS